jgi:hypothetical protein
MGLRLGRELVSLSFTNGLLPNSLISFSNRIVTSITKAKVFNRLTFFVQSHNCSHSQDAGARLRVGPELEIPGYGLLDHFLGSIVLPLVIMLRITKHAAESDVYTHSIEVKLLWRLANCVATYPF